MELNLPIYKLAGGQRSRLALAKAKAIRESEQAVNSVPIVVPNELESGMNSILSSGTIKSLEEAYDATGVSNPSPYQEDREAELNKSGYTIVNKKNCFKLSEDHFVEGIRMLYMAGYSLSDIRKKLSSLKEGDSIITKCTKVRTKFNKVSYKKLLHSNKSLRFYKEYLSVIDDSTIVVTDQVTNGSVFDSLYILMCSQNSNTSSYFSCKESSFPVKGTFDIVISTTKYSTEINAENSTALVAQLSSLPIKVSYNKGLCFDCPTSFYFLKTNISKSLGIEKSLEETKESIIRGYSGAKFITASVMEEYHVPELSNDSLYNIIIVLPTISSGNYRRIYNTLLDSGVSESICNRFLEGESIYSDLEPYKNSLVSSLESNNYPSVKMYNDLLYRNVNIRVENTTRDVIDRLLKLSNEDLEYLLRYRIDVMGIDPYVSQEEALEGLASNLSNNSGGGTYFSAQEESTPWKQMTANARYVDSMVYVMEKDYSVSKQYDHQYEQHSNHLVTWLNTVPFDVNAGVQSNSSYSDSSLGLNFLCCCDLGATFNLDSGLSTFGDLMLDIGIDQLEEFKSDILIIQSYLDAGFDYFNKVSSRLAAIIDKLNSSLSVINGGFSAGVQAGSLLQCSLNLDLGIVIPPFLSKISLALVPIIEAITAFIESVISVENKILCPIQNILDKYINGEIKLPCKITLSIPVIANIDAYLKGYVRALGTLRDLCFVVKKDANWLSYRASMMPGTMELMVTNSGDCSEV